MADKTIRECASLVMDTLHMIMRSIGAKRHKRHAETLSMPQFGALRFLKHHRGVSLSLLSSRHGSSVSSTSRLIDGLVERGYVSREVAAGDRRRIVLGLTELGEATLESIRREDVGYLAEMLRTLSAAQRATVVQAMDTLRSAFALTRMGKAASTTQQGEQSCQ